MPVDLKEEDGGKLLYITMSGKLSAADYAKFTPEVERLIKQYGKIRILCHLHDFHGWELGALWEDIKFDVKHFGDIERLAMVGETKWQQGMASFCKPFTTAKIKYFDHTQLDEAKTWVQGA